MAYDRDMQNGTDLATADEPERADERAVNELDDAGGLAADDSDAPVAMDTGGDVRADNVTISQGGARDIEATTVSITQGGAGRVMADDLAVSMGGVGFAQTERLTVDDGGSAFAVVADSVVVEEGGSVFMLLARSVSGDVRPVLDWRAALAFGAGFALVLRVLRRR